jgi:hypothetical protein
MIGKDQKPIIKELEQFLCWVEIWSLGFTSRKTFVNDEEHE